MATIPAIGGYLPDGRETGKRFRGDPEVLLLYGLPGTAKSWVSEHLAAAISGDSTLIVQGTAGTGEEAIRYGWNYAKLLAEGPSEGALVQTPADPTP